MRRLFYMLLSLFLLFLCACGSPEAPAETETDTPLQSTEPPPAIDELRTDPPSLELRYQGGSASISSCNVEWSYHTGGGKWASSIFCGAHPLDSARKDEPLTLSGGQVSMSFDEAPDTIRVTCWPESEWGNTEAASSLFSENQLDIILKPGGWIYEVNAEWLQTEARNFHGNASYVFYAITE